MTRFLALAFGITWLAVTPLVLSAWGVLPPLPAWLHGLGALGPVLAAYFCSRDRGVYESAGPSDLSRAWVAACLATPVAFAGIALAVHAFQGEPVLAPLREAAADPNWTIGLLVGSVMYGLGEEPGWRGWLQPYLQSKYPAVTATMVLAAIWGVWHAPFFVYRFEFEGVVTVVGFFIGLLAGAFWLAFLYNSTSSVKVVAVWHVLWNVANIVLAAISSTAVGVLNGLMMALGFGVAVLYRRRELRAGGAP
jgi:membrane protease YdiL (CAAX protease family)